MLVANDRIYPGWEKIKGSLISYLVAARETRLVEERLGARRTRINNLGKIVSTFRRSNTTSRDFFPTLGVITSVPHISEILDDSDEEPFEELKNGITEQLPGLATRVRKDREETLLKLLPPGYTSPEPLKLATTWFNNSLEFEAARAEDVINEMWPSANRDAWDISSLDGGVQWSSIAPKITFEKRVMAAVTKLITDLGVGDPEKMTAEELDNVQCRVVMFSKDSEKLTLDMAVGGWRHLVRILLQTHSYRGGVSLLRKQVQEVACEDLEIANWQVLKNDELPDVMSPSQLWDCAHCWRAGNHYDREEPAQTREHLRDV